jgi:hypothetical protein
MLANAIGDFLERKLTQCPQSFSIKELLDDYGEEDVHKVLKALNNAIIERFPDAVILLKATELDKMLDHLWKEAGKIEQDITRVNFVISLIFGIIGPILGYVLAGIAGLLVALVLTVVEKCIDFFGWSLGEKIVKRVYPGYIAILYDFKKKYAIE